MEGVPGLTVGSDVWGRLFEGGDVFRAAPGDIQAWKNLSDIEILLFHFWIEERLPLASWDPGARIARTGAKSLQEKSPAFAVGFQRIELSDVGPRAPGRRDALSR